MYGSLFCRIYNEFGWNEYPRVFAQMLCEWLRTKGVEARSALDLGCGTGVLCEALHAQGMDTLGIDLSADMIDLASRRAPGLAFQVGDMTELRLTRAFDLVTCTGDALNHVTDPEDVRRVFQNVHRTLNPGGYFVFDLLRDDEVPEGEPFEADFADNLRVRFRASRDSEGFTTLEIEGFEGDARRFREVIREKVYDVGLICAMLRACGFSVEQCADRLLMDSDAHGATWFVAARRI